jgi:hypothetical protein
MDAALRSTRRSSANRRVTRRFDRLGSVTSIQSLVISPTAGDGFVSFDGPAGVSGGGGVFAGRRRA